PVRLDAIEIPEISIHYLIGGMLAESEKGVAFLYLARNGKGFILISHMEQIYLARQTAVELSNQPGIAFAAMEKLALEVQRSLEYYQNTYGAQPVATLLVAAQHNPDYFVNEMAERLDLSVKILDISKLVSGLEIIPKDAFGLCLPAICAAMRPVVVAP
ncbi:MAG: hypothetical protein HQL55_10460, partial [Magnetococcales bacterium]|nr:hypothetical protein [Magnetococcales bacterium]